MSAVRLLRALRQRGLPWLSFAQALTVGAVAAYGLPGIGCWPLMLVGLIALSFWAARTPSFAMAAVIGFGFGLGVFAVSTIAAREWALVVPAALTLIATLLSSVPQALWAHSSARREYGASAFCATIAAWTLCLAVGDYVGFPTKIEGVAALSAWPLLFGGARLFGSNVVCALLIAGTLGCGVRLARLPALRGRGAWSTLGPLGAALALLLLFSGMARLSAPKATGSLSVGIPQMNVTSAYFEYRQSLPQLSDAFEELFAQQLAQLSDVDLLALSETYDGSYPLLVPKVRERFKNYARSQRQAVVLTSYLASAEGGIYNAAGVIDMNGVLVGVHRKVNLAPFGEREFQAGKGFSPATISPGVRAGVLICQESLLLEGPMALARAGANLLVSSTSDISFHSGLLSFGHLALSRMRALETGRSLVWASAGGVSGVADRWGGFSAGGPFRAPAAIRVTAELYDDSTPYLRSTWFWPLLALATLLGLSWGRGKPNPQPRHAPPPLGTLRGVGTALAALGIAWALAIASAGAVELVSGNPERAKQSALELLQRKEPYLGSGSLARFQTDLAHSPSGALAYYLDYYGQRTLPSTVQPAAPEPTLHDLAEELRVVQRFPTREQKYDFADPPRVPTLLRSKAGEFCVATTDNARRVWLFTPTRADVQPLTIAEAQSLLEPFALTPGSDPELSPR